MNNISNKEKNKNIFDKVYKSSRLKISQLHQYAEIGTVKNVSKLLQDCSISLDEKDFQGKTALHYAVSHRNFDMIDTLIKAGADLNAKDDNGRTPLHHAAVSGNQDILKKLLSASAEKNIQDNHGKTPLDYAVQFNKNKAKFLLEAEIKSEAKINIESEVKIPHHQDEAIVDKVVDNRQEVKKESGNPFQSFTNHLEIFFNDKHPARNLLRSISENNDINSRDENNKTILEYAFNNALESSENLNSDTLNIVDKLLEARANPDIIDNQDRLSLLSKAITFNHYPLFEKLLKAQANVNIQDETGKLPLHRAMIGVFGGNHQAIIMVEKLLKAGAETDFKDSADKTFEDYLEDLEEEHKKIIKKLYQKHQEPLLTQLRQRFNDGKKKIKNTFFLKKYYSHLIR